MTKYINDLVTHLEDELNEDNPPDVTIDVLTKISLIRKQNETSRVFEFDLPTDIPSDCRKAITHMDDLVWFFKAQTEQVKILVQKLKYSMLRIFDEPIEDKKPQIRQYGRGTLDQKKHQHQFQTVHLNPFFNQTSLALDLQDMSTLINYEPKLDANMSLIIDPDQLQDFENQDKAIIHTGFIKIEMEITPIDYSQYIVSDQPISFKQILEFKEKYQYLISKEVKQQNPRFKSLLKTFVENHYKQEQSYKLDIVSEQKELQKDKQGQKKDYNTHGDMSEITTKYELTGQDKQLQQKVEYPDYQQNGEMVNQPPKIDEQELLPYLQIEQAEPGFPNYEIDINDDQYPYHNEYFEENEQKQKEDVKSHKKSTKNNFKFSPKDKPYTRDILQSVHAEPHAVNRQLAIKYIEEINQPLEVNRYFEFFMVNVKVGEDETQESQPSVPESNQEEFTVLNESVPLSESNYAIPFKLQKVSASPTTINQLTDIIAKILDSIKMKKVQFQKIYQTFEYVLKGESISRAKFFASLLFVAKNKGIIIESQNKSDFEFYF